MVGANDCGRSVIVRAAGTDYAFIDGWCGTLQGFEAGCAKVTVPSDEVDGGVKFFLIPPEMVEIDGVTQ